MSDPDLSGLERRVARDREDLARSLADLGAAVDPGRLRAEMSGTAERYGRRLWSMARDNPAALALIGTAAALLLGGVGGVRRRDAPAAPRPLIGDEDLPVSGPVAPPHAAAEPTGRPPDAAPDATARHLRAALDRGLAPLPPGARRRVLRARIAAIRAQETVERQARQLTRRYPGETAAAAFGLGVLVAAALPPTQHEDALLGVRRDALLDEARRALAREFAALGGGTGGRP